MQRFFTGVVSLTLCLLAASTCLTQDVKPKVAAKKKQTAKQVKKSGESVGVPPGSYVKRPIKSSSDLVGHAQADPDIMKRYVKTYRMSPKSVAAALKGLRLTTLAKDIKANIYFVTKSGKVVYKYRKLRKGTPVFVTSTGRPALMQSCGNPISAELPTLNPFPPPNQVAAVSDLPEPPYIGAMEGFVENPNQTTLPEGSDVFADGTQGGLPEFGFPNSGPGSPAGPAQMDNFVDNPASPTGGQGFMNLPPLSTGGGGGSPIVTVPEPGSVAYATSIASLGFWVATRRRRRSKQTIS